MHLILCVRSYGNQTRSRNGYRFRTPLGGREWTSLDPKMAHSKLAMGKLFIVSGTDIKSKYYLLGRIITLLLVIASKVRNLFLLHAQCDYQMAHSTLAMGKLFIVSGNDIKRKYYLLSSVIPLLLDFASNVNFFLT